MTRTRLAIFAVLALVAATGTWYYARPDAPVSKKERSGAPAVPVVVATANLRDVPIQLEVTGRTEAYETVTLRSRVDGQVKSVAFADGQHVRQGDVADFQARLAQAQANQAKSNAQLQKARADLERAIALRAKGFVSRGKGQRDSAQQWRPPKPQQMPTRPQPNLRVCNIPTRPSGRQSTGRSAPN
ncbi:MAG: hypothetical protein IPO13_13275 [Rhodocyclaceae bacterium]|nr:hypothetical protein [Rhodocyclaceae bacterium]